MFVCGFFFQSLNLAIETHKIFKKLCVIVHNVKAEYQIVSTSTVCKTRKKIIRQHPTQSLSKNISDKNLSHCLCSQRAGVVNYPLI